MAHVDINGTGSAYDGVHVPGSWRNSLVIHVKCLVMKLDHSVRIIQRHMVGHFEY